MEYKTSSCDRLVTRTSTENVADSTNCNVNSSNPNRPPGSYKWTQSLHCLLEDSQGVALFQKFLKQEGLDTDCLSFWFASRGVKKSDPSDQKGLVKLIKLIFEKKLNKISAVSDETKEEIRQKLASNTNVDVAIFDKAQQEVEAYMMKTTYPIFLRSGLYIQYLKGWQHQLPQKLEPIKQLPMVHEDATLHIPSKISQSKKSSSESNRASYVSEFKSETPVSYLSNTTLNNDKLNSHGTFIPQMDQLSNEFMKPQIPENFHAELVKKLNKVIAEPEKIWNVAEKFKVMEVSKSSKPDGAPSHVTRQHHKSNTNAVFDPGFLVSQPEENMDYILDEHISRVFKDSGQHTPSSGCFSPPVQQPAVGNRLEKSQAPRSSSSNQLRGVMSASFKHPQTSLRSVPNSMMYRKDLDTYSTDSAMYDCKYNDTSSNYTSQYSSAEDTGSEFVFYNKQGKEHSRQSASKKFSSVTVSRSSLLSKDSGYMSCESTPSCSKVTHCLETKRMTDQERKQHLVQNSSTSSILSQSSCPQKTGNIGFRNAFNLLKAQKRLEDENKAKMQMRKPNKHSLSLNGIKEEPVKYPPSSDVTVIAYSYGRHAVPFLSKMPGKNITLRQFKPIISKKGNFRYFFKTENNDFHTGVVFEEVTEDSQVLPLWKGKVFCVIESKDDSTIL